MCTKSNLFQKKKAAGPLNTALIVMQKILYLVAYYSQSPSITVEFSVQYNLKITSVIYLFILSQVMYRVSYQCALQTRLGFLAICLPHQGGEILLIPVFKSLV